MSKLNLALKFAIIGSGKKQKRVAFLARIDEQQLSHYVHRRRKISSDEADRLCSVLRKSRPDLFVPDDIAPETAEAIAS